MRMRRLHRVLCTLSPRARAWHTSSLDHRLELAASALQKDRRSRIGQALVMPPNQTERSVRMSRITGVLAVVLTISGAYAEELPGGSAAPLRGGGGLLR